VLLIRIPERKGWTRVRTRGSHFVFAHADNPKLITVPNHLGDLKRPLLAGILKDAVSGRPATSHKEFLRSL
jgi:predicted RNA binding protein YcfA (HicA-like mRNA interferase family)